MFNDIFQIGNWYMGGGYNTSTTYKVTGIWEVDTIHELYLQGNWYMGGGYNTLTILIR